MTAPVNRSAQGFISHVKFGLAKGYCDVESEKKHSCPQNRFEWIGSLLQSPLEKVLDNTIKEMRNPVVIIGAALVASSVVSIAFYPEQFFEIVPIVKKIEPWMVKATIFGSLQATICGIGMRAFGRFSNKHLYEAWQRGQIAPGFVGDKKI